MSFYDSTISNPITVIIGNAGSGKTTMAKAIRDAVSPIPSAYITDGYSPAFDSILNHTGSPFLVVIDEPHLINAENQEKLERIVDKAASGEIRLVLVAQRVAHVIHLLHNHKFVSFEMKKHLPTTK